MNVISLSNPPAPPTASAYSQLSSASDHSTTSATAVELDTSLRCTITVPSTGKVRVRQSLVAWGSNNTQDAFCWVQVDGAGAWTRVGGFNLTIHDDFGGEYWELGGEVELTGISAGSHTFYMGWSTGPGTLSCPPSHDLGFAYGTWQSVVTLP